MSNIRQAEREIHEEKLNKIKAMPDGSAKEEARFRFDQREDQMEMCATLRRIEVQMRQANSDEDKEWKRNVEEDLKALTENMTLLGDLVLKYRGSEKDKELEKATLQKLVRMSGVLEK